MPDGFYWGKTFNLKKGVAIKLIRTLSKRSVNVNTYFQEKCIFLYKSDKCLFLLGRKLQEIFTQWKCANAMAL